MATNWQISAAIQNRWQTYKILREGMGVVYDDKNHSTYAAKTFQDEIFVSSPSVTDCFL